MRLEGEQQLCRILMSNQLFYHHTPLHEQIVEKAWKRGLAGATVTRGLEGFVPGGGVLHERLWSLCTEVPVVVEIVESTARLQAFLPYVAARLRAAMAESRRGGALITLERSRVLYYGTQAQIEERVDVDDPDDDTEEEPMPEMHDAIMLRVFVDDSDKDSLSGRPLHEALVKRAHDLGIGGATVMRGIMGFGAHASIHASRIFDAARNLPMIVEFIDTAERLAPLRPIIDEMVHEGLVTEEALRLVRFGGPATGT